MPLFSGIIAVATAVGGFIASATGVTGFLLKTALSIGLSYAAQALAGKPKQDSQPFSLQGTIRASGVVPRSFMFGRGMTAGSLVYVNTWGEAGKTPNSLIVYVIALSDLPSKGLSEIWINGEKGSALLLEEHADLGFPISEYRKDGIDHLWFKYYDGTQTVADPYLVDKFASDETYPYESTRVGKGIAYVIITARVNDTLFTGFPEFKFVLDGTKLYDPSKDSSVGGDGSQRWDTPSTWGGDGDDLPAVQAYNLIRGISYNGTWFYGLQNVAGAQVPVADAVTAIEKCRAEVDGPDGNEPQYRCSGEVLVDTKIADTVEALLTSCNGRLVEIGGFYKFKVGSADEAVGEFTDADVIATAPQSFTPFHGLADTINGIAAKYPEPAEGWNVKSAPTRFDAEFEAEDGGRRLLADVDYAMVPYKGQVQRLMESALLEARRARRHTLTLPARFWQFEPGDVLEWTSSRNGYEVKSFRIDGMTDLDNLDVLVDLTEVDSSDYDWDQEADYVPVVDGPVGIARPQPQPIIDWYAEPYVLQGANGEGRRAAIKLSWDGAIDDVEAVEYEIRLDGETEVVARGRTDQVASAALIVSQSLLSNEDYEARGRYIAASDRETLWSGWLDVKTPAITAEAVYDLVKERATTLLAEVDETIKRLARVVAEHDASNFTERQTLTRELRVQVGNARAYFSEQINVLANENEALASAVQVLGTALNAAESTILLQQSSITTIEQTLADFLVDLVSEGPGGVAQTLARFTTLSSVDGFLARILLQVRAGIGEAFAEGGLELAVADTLFGPKSVAVLGADDVFAKIGETLFPFKGLQRNDEAKIITLDDGDLIIDFGQKHRVFYCRLTADAIIRFPLNGWLGAKADLIIYNPDNYDLDVDFSSIIVNSGGLPQPTAGAGSYALYELTVMEMSPARAGITLEVDGSTTSDDEKQFSIDPPDPVTGRSVWNLAVHGPLVLDGPVSGAGDFEYTITPLGPRLDCVLALQAPGGTSGSIFQSNENVVHPDAPNASTFTSPDHVGFNTLTANPGARSNSVYYSNGSHTSGGAGGTASGTGATATSGSAGGDHVGDHFSNPWTLRAGKGGDSPAATGPTPSVLASSPTSNRAKAGVAGTDPGAGAAGAAIAGIGVSTFFNSTTGGAGGGGKITETYDTFTPLNNGKHYVIKLSAPKAPKTSDIPANWFSAGAPSPIGAPGGRARVTISALP